MVSPYFSKLLVPIRLNKDITTYNERAPNRGPLRIHMRGSPYNQKESLLTIEGHLPVIEGHVLVVEGHILIARGHLPIIRGNILIVE